jgi:SAM-dependent methyltransferase
MSGAEAGMSDPVPVGARPLAFTGERFVPGARGEIWIEHWHRYHFASRFVAGKRVLDVACGEGYGAALLGREAAHVTGVDLSPDAIAHARAAYASDRVEFIEGSCERLPLADASIDVTVSFETLEHIRGQEAFIDEIARVLKPGGVLLLSCPNRREYSDVRGFSNEFHVKELYRDELEALARRRFAELAWYGQRPTFFSLIAPEDAGRAEAQLVEVSEAKPAEPQTRPASPLYFIVVASASRAALEAIPATVSVLADRDEWARHDYEKVMRDADALQARRLELEGLVAERDRSIAGILDLKAREQSALEGEIAERGRVIAAREADVATLHGEIRKRDAAIAEREAEIVRRQGWRWCLRLPWLRLRRRL